MENIKITSIPNGPLKIEGTVTIVKTDGSVEIKEEKCSLCRCGHSANKPYCDGSHRANNFVG